MEWTASENIPDERKLCLIRNAARAALAQPSPTPELPERGTQHRFSTNEQNCRHDFAGVWWNDNGETKTGRECRHCGFFVADVTEAPAEQAEAERPEIVAWRNRMIDPPQSNPGWKLATQPEGKPWLEEEPLTTVAECARLVEALRFERQQMDRAFTACINERDAANARLHEVATACATAEQERDAALARVAELERVLRVVVNAADHGSWPTTVMHGIEKVREVIAGSAPPVKAQPEETPGEILAAKLIETWVTKHGKPAPWSTAVEITALATNMPNDERDRLLALDDDVDAQAQHSVPELDQLYSMLGAESQVDAAKKIAELIGCRMSRSALTEAQMRRIYENSTEIENERLGFAAFARLMRRAEAVHQIAAAPGKEGL
ncbi:hypothetical protein AN449_31060 [Pseudomonas aeruginosa]|nr:hypothetical protein AN449_31060 [Pseudomonas aeruginosa]